MNRLYETIRKIKGIDYRYWGFGKISLIIGPKSEPTKVKEENVMRLLDYLDKQEETDLKLYEEDRQKLVNSLSEDYRTKYQQLRQQNLQTKLRPLTKIQTAQNLSKTRVAVYGLSTEGYHIACQMAMRGANVFIIDESSQSAMSLKSEIAKTYPNVTSLKQDEPMLAMEPVDVTISKSQYVFFAPKIRKIGKEPMKEARSKFNDVISLLKKGSSVIYALPTGIGGNNENISILEHVTGFEVGKSVFYYYYPLLTDDYPHTVLGSYKNRQDPVLANLLALNEKEPLFSISEAERVHAMNIMSRFARLYGIVQTSKSSKEEAAGFVGEYENIFLDDMMSDLYDLKLLSSSLAESDWFIDSAKTRIKILDEYVQRLLEEVRTAFKKNKLKPETTRVALAWSALDLHEMRGDKFEMLQNLISKMRDVSSDVDVFDESELGAVGDKHTIVVACSRKDYENNRKITQKMAQISLIAPMIVYPK